MKTFKITFSASTKNSIGIFFFYCMKAGQRAAHEKLLERAADSLQEMTEELDGDMNNALAMEIYETLKR